MHRATRWRRLDSGRVPGLVAFFAGLRKYGYRVGVDTQRICATVIVAEDDPDIRDMLGAALRRAGYEAALHADAEAALQTAAHRAPGLYLFDIGLPGMSGIHACRTVKQSPALCRPVLLLTARLDAGRLQQARDAGADAVLPKPFTLTQLADCVSELTLLAPSPAMP